MHVPIFLSLTLTFALFTSLPFAIAASTCNGFSTLCSKLYSNVTFIGAHDSYAVGSSIADNQDKNVTGQLNDGIRTLQIQTHNTSTGIHVCHTSCDLVDGGSLQNYLASVASWLDSNPNEVVTLVMVNIDDLAPSNFDVIFQAVGLSTKAYAPSAASISLNSWPTLGSLIDNGTPLVVFMDTKADFTSVPYIIDEFSNMWEDAYDVTTTTYDCAVNRTTGTATTQLMMINHFLDNQYNFGGTVFWVPDKSALTTTNAASGAGSIGFHVGNCENIWGRAPNHILLDYYDSNGNAPFDVAATLNGVSQPTNTVTPVSTQTSGTTSGSGSAASLSTSKLSGAKISVEISGKIFVGSVLAVLIAVNAGLSMF